MLQRLFLAFAIVIVVAGPARAASTCKPVGTPEIAIQSEKPRISYDQALSRDAILAFARRNDPSAGRGYDGLLGITDTDLKRSARYEVAIVQNPTGDYCFSFHSIDVTLTWTIVVHVASQLKPGSCMYRVVSTHEQGHVDIDLAAMGYGQRLMEAALASLKGKAIAAATPEAGTAILKQALTEKLDAAFNTLEADLKQRQKGHDTPEEYAKPAKICGVEENNRALED